MTDSTTIPTDKAGEPVAWRWKDCGIDFVVQADQPHPYYAEPLYTHPQPSLSVGLDRDVRERLEQMVVDCEAHPDLPMMLDAETCLEHASDLRSLLALAAPAEGYVLVPVEPTEAMLDAAQSKIERAQKQGWAGLGPLSIYRAMIAACLPAAPTGGRS